MNLEVRGKNSELKSLQGRLPRHPEEEHGDVSKESGTHQYDIYKLILLKIITRK
jgi:hypothetical protein